MPLLEKEDVEEIAKKVFKEDVIEEINYDIVPKSENILGHLGNHFVLLFKVFSRGNVKDKIAFVKTYGLEDEEKNFVGKAGIFQKEVDVYKILIEDIRSLVGELSWCPKYYFSKSKILVLEDLSEFGFKMAAENITLDEKHLEVAFQALASMHASSFFLEKKKSVPLNSVYSSVFKELLYDENKPQSLSRKWLLEQIQDLLVGIDHLSKYSQKEKIQIRALFFEEIMRIYPLSQPSRKYQNVFVHGDLWSNNLLFRYSGNIPVECRFVDFQFSRYAPPAHDVMHLLLYTTKKSMRNRRGIALLRSYYENLIKELKLYDETSGVDLPWDEFFKSCQEYKELALIQCLLSLHYLLGPVSLSNSEGLKSTNRKEYMQKFFSTDLYSERVTELFDELIATYIIGNR